MPSTNKLDLKSLFWALLFGLLLWPSQLLGQSTSQSGEPDGITSGGYIVHSSVDLGYRSSDVTGSVNMYDTLVNLQSGPRILDQTLSMRSLAGS